MKEILQKVNKLYLANGVLFTIVIASILLMFVVQFKVENLLNKVNKIENEIANYEDDIQLLEVEWVYLTRPDRLRKLSAQYLQNNNYALASQIKDMENLERYYLVNYKKVQKDNLEIASNTSISF